MSSKGSDSTPMNVWCPIIPVENMREFSRQEKGLRKITDAYYDWCAAMRPKPLVGTTVGVLLDRIRMLMINMGIAVGQNRELAEAVQKIVSEKLRTGAVQIVSMMPTESSEKKAIKKTLALFFARVKFTRDIDPAEEIRTSMPDPASLISEQETNPQVNLMELRRSITKRSLEESANVVKRLYVRLLSPDPWGDE